MKNKNIKLLAFGTFALMGAMLLNSCVKENPDSPGFEYMPDMYRSPSVETNGKNAWLKDSVQMGNMIPPDGTVPRGFIPFPYPNTIQGDSLASLFWKNPLPKCDSIEEEGKKLFEINCIYCHGPKGDGQGPLVTSNKYGATPPNYATKYADGVLTDGHIYHVITYGKGNMGSHAYQLTPEERWKVIEYVQRLGRGGKPYSEWMKDQQKLTAAADSVAAKNPKNGGATKTPPGK
ncbi:MAG TPA: cytochrome c [Bacteroidia bacterium]|nr:cytochrome c [Bacteroidia bacterium]